MINMRIGVNWYLCSDIAPRGKVYCSGIWNTLQTFFSNHIFFLCASNLQTGEDHTVTQMQYIDWPDHGKNYTHYFKR